jgi:ArsR family transcriptional regulator
METKNLKKIKKELENKKEILKCAREFKMVGDPTRLKICYLLCKHKELSVGEIAKIVGVSVSAVSHTLAKLKRINLIEKRKEAKNVYYSLKESPLVELIKKELVKT